MSGIIDDQSACEEIFSPFPSLALFDLSSCLKDVSSQLEIINDTFVSFYRGNKVGFENYQSWAPFCRSQLPNDRYNMRDGINIREEEDRLRALFASEQYCKEREIVECPESLKKAQLFLSMHPNEVAFSALPGQFFNDSEVHMTIPTDPTLLQKRKAERQQNRTKPEHSGFQFIRALKYHKSACAASGFEGQQCECVSGDCLGASCLNFSSNEECGADCRNAGCQNNRIRQKKWHKQDIRQAGEHGRGAFASDNIAAGAFLTEYVGEVISQAEHTLRTTEKQAKHFYTVQLDARSLIDASEMGNLARFMNHSCEPNCHSQKWIVNGYTRLGLFAIKPIKKGDEVTWDYQYEAKIGEEKIPCLCGSANCTKFLGNKR